MKINFKSSSATLLIVCAIFSCEKKDPVKIDEDIIPEIVFNSELEYDSISDIVGNHYKTIQIDNQIWMAENLKTTKLNDGNDIPQETYYSDWNDLSTPAYCWYDNDKEKYKDAFGALYNFHTIKTEKLCPTGWHVPTNSDWTTLIEYLGGDSIAGGKLKETDTLHWSIPNFGATNSSGFTALASGRRIVGLDHDKGYLGSWWSAEPSDTSNPYFLNIYKYDDFVLFNNIGGFDGKNDGLSVRCIKD